MKKPIKSKLNTLNTHKHTKRKKETLRIDPYGWVITNTCMHIYIYIVSLKIAWV